MHSIMGGEACSAQLQHRRTRAETSGPADHMACLSCCIILHREGLVTSRCCDHLCVCDCFAHGV